MAAHFVMPGAGCGLPGARALHVCCQAGRPQAGDGRAAVKSN